MCLWHDAIKPCRIVEGRDASDRSRARDPRSVRVGERSPPKPEGNECGEGKNDNADRLHEQ